MNDKDMKDYLDTYRNEHGEAVPISELLRSFEGFRPAYSPRRRPKDPRAAEQNAKMRAFIRLAELLEEKASELTTRPTQESLDIAALARELGYGNPKRMKFVIPDYVVVLDDQFFDFVQSLPRSIGGSKRQVSAQQQGTKELEEFRAAMEELRASRSEAAMKFVKVYDRVRSKLRLPKA